MSDHQNTTATPEGVGNPALWHVRDFVDEPAAAPVNPFAVIARIFRGLWVPTLAAALLVGITAGFATYSYTKPIYESQGLVRIIARDPKILFADRDDTRLRIYDAFVSSEATYMQSKTVLNRAYQRLLDTVRDRPVRGPSAETLPNRNDFSNALIIKKQKGLIAVSAKSSQPLRAKQYVQSLLGGYAELHAEQSGSRQTLRARELEVRVLELQAKQQKFSQKLLEIGEEYDVSSLAKAHLTKVTQLEALDLRLESLATTILEIETADGALDIDIGDMEIKRATLLDRAMADMIFERTKRAADLKTLYLRYQPAHPKIVTLKASLGVIDQAIETRRRLISTLGKAGAITGSVGGSAAQSLSELKALEKKLMSRRKELSRVSILLNGKLIELRRISAEKNQITGMLSETRRILDQVVLESRNSMPGTIDILAAGDLPDTPATDKRKQFSLLAFVGCGGLVFVFVFCKRRFSGRVKFSDDIQGTLPVGTDMSVMADSADDAVVAAFLGDLQLSRCWQKEKATLISFLRFSETTHVPLAQLASLAASQGLKTLLICAANDSVSSTSGFSDSIKNRAKFSPHTLSGYDFLPYGTSKTPGNYTVESAQAWLNVRAQEYDLLLLYSGIPERHLSARIIPSLSHITVTVISPGVKTRLLQRTLSRTPNVKTLFTGAASIDPNLIPNEKYLITNEGKQHETAA